ncbi:MAG TPA: PAS domain-containing protein [Caulobacteraceae bacterium]|jgi:hypothetical protein|nr:PAS domain-containing protein [Caulobacteraceae bacterium]
MFHANTRKVIEDWNARRGARRAPARADISPGAFSDLVPQLFILGAAGDGTEPFRLAGGLLADLHDRDLRGVDFFSLFIGEDKDAAREALATARRTGSPVVIDASGWSAAGDEARLEIVLAPLLGPSGDMDRVLGLYQPTSSVRRLMGARIEALTLNEVRLADLGPLAAFVPSAAGPHRRDRSHLRLVALNGERVG